MKSKLILLIVVLAAAAPARAIFGIGKKADDADQRRESTQKLPGMPQPGEDGQPVPGMPRMSDEMRKAEKAAREQGPASPQSKPSTDESASPAASVPPGSMPTEVVIKGQEGANKLNSQKPQLHIDADSFESIRSSLKPDESLLLAESPLTITWRRTHPEFLLEDRVVQPWRTTFSERPGIAFYPREQLYDAIGRRLEPGETKSYQWQLTIADEEGRVFQHYEGSSNPPEELIWSGQTDQGEWIKAGRAYSPIYLFTDTGGSPHTKVGKTLQFTGVIHQESDGLHISLDSSVLFGTTKGSRTIEKGGEGLVRSAADLIKRRYTGIPIRVEAYGSSRDLGEAQAKLVKDSLGDQLMLLKQNVSSDGAMAPFSEQRVELVLLNR